MAYDKTPLVDSISKNTFSEDLAKHVPTPQEIQEKLKKGNNPVLLSIYKWEKIIKAVEEISKKDTLSYQAFISQWRKFVGYETCALCLDSIARLHKIKADISSKTEKCSVCALAKIDRCIDEDSIFKQLEFQFQVEFNRDNKEKYTEVLISILNKMVSNLKALKSR
ncbi:MAG: hypothetical protein ABUK01_06660 [Leptospirales bacterium]